MRNSASIPQVRSHREPPQAVSRPLVSNLGRGSLDSRTSQDRPTTSPTQRTLQHLREAGYPLVQVVERYNHYARVRQDLFGIIDVVAVGKDIVAVQTTSMSNVSSHLAKITESEALPILRKAGIRVLIHGWGKRKGRVVLREIDVS